MRVFVEQDEIYPDYSFTDVPRDYDYDTSSYHLNRKIVDIPAELISNYIAARKQYFDAKHKIFEYVKD